MTAGPSSRTFPAEPERAGADLESMLGATPREFESRILRHADLQEHRRMAANKWAHCVAVGSFKGPSSQPRTVPLPISARRLCLVRGITDGPERGAHAVRACAPQNC